MIVIIVMMIISGMGKRRKRAARCGAEQVREERLGLAVSAVFTGMLAGQRVAGQRRREIHRDIGERLASLGQPGGLMLNATRLFGEEAFMDVKVNFIRLIDGQKKFLLILYLLKVGYLSEMINREDTAEEQENDIIP